MTTEDAAAVLCGDSDGPHDLRWRGTARKGYVYKAGTRAEVRAPKGVHPCDYLRAIVEALLAGGCVIGRVDGEDTEAALRLPEGAEL